MIILIIQQEIFVENILKNLLIIQIESLHHIIIPLLS